MRGTIALLVVAGCSAPSPTFDAGGVSVDDELVPDGGHLDVAFGSLAYPQSRTAQSISWLKARLDAP